MQKSVLLSTYILVFIGFFGCPYTIHGTTKSPDTQVFSIDIKNKTPVMILRDLQKAFSVKINIVGSLSDELISLTLKNVTLEEGVRKIIQNAHIENFSIISNKDNNVLTIHTLSSDKGSKAESNLSNDHNNTNSLKEEIMPSTLAEDPYLNTSRPDDTFDYASIPPAPSSDKSHTNTNKKILQTSALSEDFDFDKIPPSPRLTK